MPRYETLRKHENPRTGPERTGTGSHDRRCDVVHTPRSEGEPCFARCCQTIAVVWIVCRPKEPCVHNEASRMTRCARRSIKRAPRSPHHDVEPDEDHEKEEDGNEPIDPWHWRWLLVHVRGEDQIRTVPTNHLPLRATRVPAVRPARHSWSPTVGQWFARVRSVDVVGKLLVNLTFLG